MNEIIMKVTEVTVKFFTHLIYILSIAKMHIKSLTKILKIHDQFRFIATLCTSVGLVFYTVFTLWGV